jgi:tetratricopeptide (TPR) repeat protein
MKSEKFWEWYNDFAAPRLDQGPFGLGRANTFRKMLEHCDQFEHPVIVETGCIEDDTNWIGNGCSTIIFDKYVSMNEGNARFYSVDIIPDRVVAARRLVGDRTTIDVGNSIEWLKYLHVHPDLLYLDASHLSWVVSTPAQVHHYNELMAVMPWLRPDSLVVVDDSPAVLDERSLYEVRGKGGLVAVYAAEVCAEMVFCEYQTGWVGFPGRSGRTEDDLVAIVLRAREMIEAGRWAQATMLYKNVLVRTPPPWTGKQRIMHGEAASFFARVSVQNKMLGHAFDWFRRSLEADPYATDYRIEMIDKCMLPMGMLAGAMNEGDKCTRVSPEDEYAWKILAKAQGAGGHYKSSTASYRHRVELANRSSVSLLDLASTLIDEERYSEAEGLCDEVLARPDDKFRSDAFHCKAMILARFGHHEQACVMFQEAIDGGCADPTLASFHLAISLHSIGRYKEGWDEHAKRKDNKSSINLFVPMQRFSRGLFEMQPPPAIVHIHSEAGAGDNIQFMRYLPMLAERGYTVRYECRDDLLTLAKGSLPTVEVVPTALNYPGALGIKEFDYHAPIGELPHIFGTEVDTVPWSGPYIKADPELAEKYSLIRPKFGIAWSSGIRKDGGAWLERYGEIKSLRFEDVRRISDSANYYNFVNLQVGPPRARNDLWLDVLPEDPTWADTAALIANLDLVITPDTGLAHLAGAMGKPVMLMMHREGSFHWMVERKGAKWNRRSPWYPSVLIYRQKTSLIWDDVIERIITDLRTGAWRNELLEWPYAKGDQPKDAPPRDSDVAAQARVA